MLLSISPLVRLKLFDPYRLIAKLFVPSTQFGGHINLEGRDRFTAEPPERISLPHVLIGAAHLFLNAERTLVALQTSALLVQLSFQPTYWQVRFLPGRPAINIVTVNRVIHNQHRDIRYRAEVTEFLNVRLINSITDQV